VADEILCSAAVRTFDACLLAAQTIRQKVLGSFAELPPASYQSLQQSLLNHLWFTFFERNGL
jgi:hypothetical protein